MDNSEDNIPRVFISYSHDSKDHKKWVVELASKLADNGIDVILDQWELSPGDDVPKFMERSVTETDRVLMICTETYVRKADKGKGGVGYEAMIVTGELIRDMGTSKFIPIIRQKGDDCLLPKSASTRLYINLSEGENFAEEFEKLIKDLHNVPALPKPKLGKNPFVEQITVTKPSPIPDISLLKQDISVIYNTALEITRQDDMVAWRKIVRQAKQPIAVRLSEWREKYEHKWPGEKEKKYEFAAEGVSIYAPLFIIALTGVESGKDKFNNQVAILDDILYPKDWNRSGLSVIVQFPETIAFVYQALHGAMCLQTGQLNLAIILARTKIEDYYGNKNFRTYQDKQVVGWLETFDLGCRDSWEFLMSLPDRWDWLEELYGEPDEFRAAVSAYYMALNILELADTIASQREEIVHGNGIYFNVPLCFLKDKSKEVIKKAYHLLLNEPEQVRGIWRNLKVEDSKMEELWPGWIKNVRYWLHKVYNFIYRDITYFPLEDLFKDLV